MDRYFVGTQKVIPIEQGLKHGIKVFAYNPEETQKVIPIEQGLKPRIARTTGFHHGLTQKVIPIEQGLKPRPD